MASQVYFPKVVSLVIVINLFKLPLSGSYLFNKVLDKSYSIMFIINASCLVLAVLYSILRLKVSRNSKTRSQCELFAIRTTNQPHQIDS